MNYTRTHVSVQKRAITVKVEAHSAQPENAIDKSSICTKVVVVTVPDFGESEAMSRTDIAIEIDFTGALNVKWSGRANDRRPAAALNPLFEKLVSMRCYLRFDFSELEHMASSTLVVLLKNFKALHEAGIGFEFRYDDRIGWQRMTFKQLEAVAAPEPSFTIAA